MRKWLKFFFLGFFSHSAAKEGRARGFTNAFLSFVLALSFLWVGFIGADMLPFGAHYNNSPDFSATVRSVLANPDPEKRIYAQIKDGELLLKEQGGEYAERLFVNTLQSDADKESYSTNGYNIVVDTRAAGTLAEVVAHCVSNDGKNTVISYEDYLGLSEVARLNFDFKLSYTGNALDLTDEAVEGYRVYLMGSDDEKDKAEGLAGELAEGKITRDEYNKKIYELYFAAYYPKITEYESTSVVPLLRNYYYHQYITKGEKNYLFIFDDYMTGSFETNGGIEASFHGFYTELEDGSVVAENLTQDEAYAAVDNFVKKSFGAVTSLNSYVYVLNVFSLLPFVALMLLVATLLTYSIMRLRGVESIVTLGSVIKIVGGFMWFSGVISAALSIIASFFVSRNLISALPPVIFFVALAARSIIFAIQEGRLSKQSQQQQAEQTGG